MSQKKNFVSLWLKYLRMDLSILAKTGNKKENKDRENWQEAWESLKRSPSFKGTDGAFTGPSGLSNLNFETKHCST